MIIPNPCDGQFEITFQKRSNSKCVGSAALIFETLMVYFCKTTRSVQRVLAKGSAFVPSAPPGKFYTPANQLFTGFFFRA
jgi:hypothetical protein